MRLPALFFIFILMTVTGVWILNHSFKGDQKESLATNLIIPSPTIILPPTSTPSPVPISNVQIIKATYGPPFGFIPTEFTVKAGIPVRLEVYATENGRGCMGSIMLPELLPGDVQGFTKGETNIFEFTPQTPGTYQIACAMGIPHGDIVVK